MHCVNMQMAGFTVGQCQALPQPWEPIQDTQKPSGFPEKDATLDAEWQDFTRLIGEAAFAPEKPDDAQIAKETSHGSDMSLDSGSRHSSRASSRSKKSSSSSRSRSRSPSVASSGSRSRSHSPIKEFPSADKIVSPKLTARKCLSRSDSSSSERESPTHRKPSPKLTSRKHSSRSDSSSSERESPAKRRSPSPKTNKKKVDPDGFRSNKHSDGSHLKQAKRPGARKYRSRSRSHSPKRSRSRKSRDRSGSKERKRRKERTRERKYSRSSGTKSPSRRRKSRSRSRNRRKHRKHSRSRSRSHDRKKHRSHQRRRPSRKSRSRSPNRKHFRSRRKHSRSRSRDRHPKRRERRSRSRSRAKDFHKPARPIPEDVSKVKKKNEPLTFKEKLKQSWLDIQKQAAKGELVINSESTKALELMAASEKQSNIPSNLKTQLANVTSGSQVTPQMALLQTMAAMHQKAQELTGVAVPKYYNPAAVNPLKYAEQVQKRKLLWSKNKEPAKTEETSTEAAVPSASHTVWESTKFAQDQDGKVSAKFRKLMGIKQGSSETVMEPVKDEKAEELNQKHAELFSRLDREYEFARMTTHTHRGVGLGFASQGMPDI